MLARPEAPAGVCPLAIAGILRAAGVEVAGAPALAEEVGPPVAPEPAALPLAAVRISSIVRGILAVTLENSDGYAY